MIFFIFSLKGILIEEKNKFNIETRFNHFGSKNRGYLLRLFLTVSFLENAKDFEYSTVNEPSNSKTTFFSLKCIHQ